MDITWTERKEEWIHRVKWNCETIIRNRNYGLVIRSFIVVLFVSIFTIIGMKESLNASASLQKGIASEIIRFHVIANSDLDEDQAVKIKVKDAVVTALRPKMSETKDILEAREEILENMEFIQQVAVETLRANGYEYGAKVSLAKEQFPIKVYGDITLPAGEYEALCIRLGDAKGHNWWCIVFPSLCYVDETYSYVPDDSKEQFKQVLTEEEYDEITTEDAKGDTKIKIKVKFKLWDYLKKCYDSVMK